MKYLKIQASPGVKKEIKQMMIKMKFKDESLFLRYCMFKAYKRFAPNSKKKIISKEIALIGKTRCA